MNARRPYQFAVLGNAVVDAIARVDEAFLDAYKLKKGDSNTLSPAEMLDLSSKAEVHQFRSGGSSANTAYTLAKLGARVAFLGMIGEDPTGRFFAEELVASGVTVTPPHARHRTVEVFTLLTSDGVRTMVQSQPAAPSTDDSWVDETLIEQAEWLVIESYVVASHPAAVEFAVRVARQKHTKLAFSLGSPRGVMAALAILTEMASAHHPLLIGNEKDWKALLEGNEPHAVKHLERCPRVITRSGAGATFFPGTGAPATESSTQPIANPVDMSGAGDAFAAGFLFTYAGGGSPEFALKQGNQLGRALVLQLGPRLQNVPELADPDGMVLSSN